ncbi:MAG: flagellar biosynthetic protein FliR [Proteobacteria bacterium]|nr:MAG: flagellar biosynthetic protein FliR [Pseudomonadota bacterium]PIE67130.1 MAG: flagellar biosynthetic protein FliR [Deltaproteobacteria bacterium]
MASLNVPLDAFYALLLIFFRVIAILFSSPILDTATIPVLFRAALALAVSVLLLPLIDTSVNLPEMNLIAIVLGIVSEIVIGITIGLTVKLLFTGIQLAGQIAGYQMGFAVANVMDPATSAQIPLLSQLFNLTAMLVFLSINAHHMFFSALVDSYTLIPPLSMQFRPELTEFMMTLAANMFTIAIKVGAPLIAVMLLVSVGMGLVARTVPQIHIFIVAMPLKILIGFAFMLIVAPYLTAFLIDLFSSYRVTLYEIIELMAAAR